jgi:hypothetical protein
MIWAGNLILMDIPTIKRLGENIDGCHSNKLVPLHSDYDSLAVSG